jgi:putative tricarboxylic transport membrane protein
MGLIENVLYGFGVAFTPINLFLCFMGAVAGTLVGVLPGLGPVGAMSMLLPVTFVISPTGALIMLAGIYYGAQYGGSITSILLNVPGEATTIVTCLDGNAMAKKGRAGPALGISAFGSFIAGTLAICGTILFAFPLTSFALKFGPPEYFGLICMGLVILTYLSRASMLKSLLMAVLGIFVSTIGMDSMTGVSRFSFGSISLREGVGLVPIAMGMFGLGEILTNLEQEGKQEVLKAKLTHLFPNLQDWRDSAWPILRGTILGFFLGILPGGGALVSSFASYAVEKKLSKYPEKFGTGVIEGVAGPESANNSGAQASFIPLLTLGIPTNIVTAILLGALLIHGITPGPLLMKEKPDLFWGVITSMYIGNIMLLVLNLPLIPLWVKILRVPKYILFPLILLFCLIGVYTVNNNVFDIFLMIFFGIVGYVVKRLDFEPAPFILAVVLGPIFEENLRQSLIFSRGDFSIFFTRPIALGFMIVTILLIVFPFIPHLKRKKMVLAGGEEES